ncbi:MAG: glycosyltransferase family 4 protein, partial [Anaerolineales bacterium]
DPRKNVSMLLDAFARIRAARPELKLVIIGDRPSPAQQRQTQRLQLDGSVLYLPPKPPSELIPFYQAAELFVLSSTQEGLAISMLESLACGLPVVATRCGGPEGVIRNDETGLLVPNDNAAAFAEGVLSLLHDPARATAMRKRAAGFAQANVAQPLIANQLRKSLGHVYPQHFDA